MKILAPFLAAFCAAAAFAAPAQAHPHVWVTVTSQVIYDSKGEATGIRQAWKFDDMYSTFALEGLEQKTKGVYTREELAPLAQVNMTSLKDSDYFTFAKTGGKDMEFGDPVDYWLDYKDESLTLNFTLPFKTPVKAKDLLIDIYDPEFFVSFEFGESDPVKLAGAPAACKFEIMRPNDNQFPSSQRLDKNLRESTENQGMGQLYANKIAVKCP